MRDQIIEYIIAEYPKSVLSDLFPDQKIEYISSGGADIPDYIDLRETNASFKDSDYFINPTGKNYIHFTSIENYINICSTNEFRLYDLNFVDDPNEILFAAKNLGITEYYDYDQIKAAINSLSFCTYPFTDEVVEHDLWRLYGGNGNGIGIIFHFENDCFKWKNSHLSKVYYNQTANINKLKDALSKHEAFLSTLKEKFQITGDKQVDFPTDFLIKLLSFHKNSIYKSENELRLIYLDKPSNRYSANRFYTLNRRKQASNYINLPLFNWDNHQENQLSDFSPVIKIDKIVLGYRYSNKDRLELQSSIREIIVHNYKHYSTNTPEVEITGLIKYFS